MSQTSRFLSLQHAPLSRIDIPSEMTIKLSATEKQVCELFDECTKYLKAEKGLQTSCRIAGGWVRDKLLRRPDSHDIDIAVSDIMGLAFAEHLAEYTKKKGVYMGTITKISKNPDQSKHLETATFKFLGLSIDLVNLRHENYAEDSRIPTGVSFGTPLEDALRRDTTINSLFFNMHTREVEDHTGKGLNDLRKGIIRTPLPPKETFQDDPLRVLRCIRFASRFGFEMVPEIAEAAQDPDIQEALVSKVARERIGDELSKMMTGRDPFGALQHIHNFSLHDTIFSHVPSEYLQAISTSAGPRITAVTAAYLLHQLLHPSDSFITPLHPTLKSTIVSDPSCMARLYLATALIPYGGIASTRKKPHHWGVELAIRESLKLGSQHHYLDGITLLFDAASEKLHNPTLEKFQKPSERVALGLLLRDKKVHNPNTGSHWATSLLFSLVQELVPLYDIVNDKLEVSEAMRLVELYNTLTNKIEELRLPETIDAKPVLNGHEIVQILGQTKQGRWMQMATDKVLEWQLEHPEGNKDACIEWLQELRRAGGLPIEQDTAEPPAKKVKRK